MEELLRIENFTLTFHGQQQDVTAVRQVNLTVHAGEKVAIVGESGSGKTSLCRAILMLHAKHATVDSGRIYLLGQEMTSLKEEQLQQIRGRDASMIFQDPLSSLNPVYSIKKQITLPLQMHRGMDKAYAEKYAAELLGRMGFSHPEEILKKYPHELSGGMRQRVAIAIAISCDPKLIIADEPTTALDVHTQQRIIDLLQSVAAENQRGMIFISHDLSLARQLADRIIVMQDGVIIEEGTPAELFANPKEEYTKKLIRYAQYGKGTVHQHGSYGLDEGEDAHFHRKDAEPLVAVRHVDKQFDGKSVLSDVTLDIRKGEILGLVGASGCGKSTLAGCIMGIHSLDSGSISISLGTKSQMIFQDSAEALNPRMTIEQIIAEPLMINTWFSKRLPEHVKEKVREVMEQVHLEADLKDRHPYDVSGGQRQRAAIARALITDPDFIIADEPISSLDVTIQAQIIHLLKELKDQRNLTMLLIAHDIPMVEHISDRILYL